MWPDRLPKACRAYPAREVDGLIFVFPGDSGAGGEPSARRLGASQRRDYKTRRLNREVACHYTFMHENLFDMNHQFMHRKQMGSIRARCLGRDHGENWAEVEYSFSRTGGKSSVGEQVIVDLMRKRSEAKKDFSRSHVYPYRLSRPEPQGVGGPGYPARPTIRCWTCGSDIHPWTRATHQSHLRLSVREEAAACRGSFTPFGHS